MVSIASGPAARFYLHRNPIVFHNLILSSSSLSFTLHSPCRAFYRRPFPLHNGDASGGVRSGRGAAVLRKPVVSPALPEEELAEDFDGEREQGRWVDWEDRILEDTVPLVGFMRMILHSGKYECGDRLSPEHERIILTRLLPYHPEGEKKIGSGVDYIKVGYHPIFGNSKCLFVVQKDGEVVDFSYWKCIKGLIRKNYPLHAESFILRHFRRRRNID